jgi:hypothetical protein
MCKCLAGHGSPPVTWLRPLRRLRTNSVAVTTDRWRGCRTFGVRRGHRQDRAVDLFGVEPVGCRPRVGPDGTGRFTSTTATPASVSACVQRTRVTCRARARKPRGRPCMRPTMRHPFLDLLDGPVQTCR